MYLKPVRNYPAPFYISKCKFYKIINTEEYGYKSFTYTIIADHGHKQQIDDENCEIFNEVPNITLTEFQLKGGYA
jgi:hypothetical protein